MGSFIFIVMPWTDKGLEFSWIIPTGEKQWLLPCNRILWLPGGLWVANNHETSALKTLWWELIYIINSNSNYLVIPPARPHQHGTRFFKLTLLFSQYVRKIWCVEIKHILLSTRVFRYICHYFNYLVWVTLRWKTGENEVYCLTGSVMLVF